MCISWNCAGTKNVAKEMRKISAGTVGTETIHGSVNSLTRQELPKVVTSATIQSPCQQPGYHPKRKILTMPAAIQAYENAVKKTLVYRCVGSFCHCRDTYWVESFNHQLLTYLPKRIHFQEKTFDMRMNLAVMDWNENTQRVATSLLSDFSVLPPEDRNIVRIFLSSTFGDFVHERNRLAKDVFPVLQSYCQHKGLEFQVIDMRWGVRDENISLHLTSDVCIQEIRNCQRLSLGPSFLALLGDRYGYIPLLSTIPTEEFELFLTLADAHNVETSLLTMWYKLDSNANPPVYQLQPITTYFPDFTSTKKTFKKQHSTMWQNEFEKLQNLIWQLAEMAVKDAKMSLERFHLYNQSVTEDEIRHGILAVKSPNDHCLCYNRQIVGINKHDAAASKYTDVDPKNPNKINSMAQDCLKCLKNERIPFVLDSSNIRSYAVTWSHNTGIDTSLAEHENYLKELCSHVLSDVKSLIDKSLNIKQVQSSALHQDVTSSCKVLLQQM
ncbi:hypothetical protein EMCRGX_G023180 [Ephydatia muelleri]